LNEYNYNIINEIIKNQTIIVRKSIKKCISHNLIHLSIKLLITFKLIIFLIVIVIYCFYHIKTKKFVMKEKLTDILFLCAIIIIFIILSSPLTS